MQATATTLDHEQEYTPINSRNKVLVASLIGTAIEFFDFYIYATAAVIVFPHIFFPQGDPTAATLQSLATFAIAFVARPIGSAVFGHFGDRVGRKATLVASLLTMGISTVVIGLLRKDQFNQRRAGNCHHLQIGRQIGKQQVSGGDEQRGEAQ